MNKEEVNPTFPILYKKDKKSKLMQWQIFMFKSSFFYTEEGYVGGTITATKPTLVKKPTRGKTLRDTTIARINSLIKKKKDSGYYEDGETPYEFFSPMLAFDMTAKKKAPLFEVPTFVQPKLDGIRSVSFNNKLQSRQGKFFLSCPHLYRDSNVILDGELYNHLLKDDFNAVVSLIKKSTNLTPEHLKKTKDFVQFHAYDMPGPGVFSERYEELKRYIEERKLEEQGYVLVPTIQVHNLEELEKAHESFLEQGYEGTIVRLDIGGYENSRSIQLLKKKDFMDEEFEIVGWEEGVGNRAGTIGEFHLLTKEGKQFSSNVKGDFTYLTDLWEDINRRPHKFKGMKATVKFFKYTPAGIPRFPIVIKLGREEYE